MAKPYRLLRDLLKVKGVTEQMLARQLLLTQATVSRKMCGLSAWSIGEMWQIMSIIGAKDYRLHEIFPRDGKDGQDG